MAKPSNQKGSKTKPRHHSKLRGKSYFKNPNAEPGADGSKTFVSPNEIPVKREKVRWRNRGDKQEYKEKEQAVLAARKLQQEKLQSVQNKKKDEPDKPKNQSSLQRFIEQQYKAASEFYTASVAKEEGRKKSSDERWAKAVITSGTSADRLAAATLRVQEDPVHNLGTLDMLLALASKRNHTEVQQAIDTLRDLFVSTLLPQDRKLLYFANQPWDENKKPDKDALIQYYWEDSLKSRYAQFVQILERQSHNMLEQHKRVVVKTIFNLLLARSEQEQVLLSILVGKLGDPIDKIASMVGHLLWILLKRHQRMRTIVVNEVEMFVFRKNVSEKARYYSLVFLNTIQLDEHSAELANRLVKIYFDLFKAATRDYKKFMNDPKTRMLGALLAGMTRTFPFSKLDAASYDQHMDALFVIVHNSPFPRAVQALSLILSVTMARRERSPRFYRALYSLILSPELFASSYYPAFLNLVFRALKFDDQHERIRAFLKRLLQVTLQQKVPLICGMLYTLTEVSRVKSVVRHFINEHHQPTITQPTINPHKDGQQTDKTESSQVNGKAKAVAIKSEDESEYKPPPGTYFLSRGYAPLKLQPEHAHAGGSALWELALFVMHFHPTVRSFAESLLYTKPIEYEGNPLEDFGLMPFLDKFVTKKPKKATRAPAEGDAEAADEEKGTGANTIKKFEDSDEETDAEIAKRVSGKSNVDFLGRERPDELFFHEFYKNKSNKSKLTDAELAYDSDDFNDDFDDEEVEAALISSGGFGDDLGEDDDEIDMGHADRDEDEDEDDGLVLDDEDGVDGARPDFDFSDDDEDVDDDFSTTKSKSKSKSKSRKFDDDVFGIDDDDEDDDEEETRSKNKKKKNQRSNPFASITDSSGFADADALQSILEGAGSSDKSKKHKQWEARSDPTAKAYGGRGGSKPKRGGKRQKI